MSKFCYADRRDEHIRWFIAGSLCPRDGFAILRTLFFPLPARRPRLLEDRGSRGRQAAATSIFADTALT